MAHPFMHLSGFSDFDAEQLIYAAPNANTKFMDEFAQDGVVAEASGTQALATQLIAQTNRVVTVAGSGYGVKLPESKPGRELMLINSGVNSMQVFGSGTDTIDGQASATGVPQMPNSLVIYTCVTAGAWYTEGLATGYWGPGLQSMSSADNISAVGGPQTQAQAAQLARMNNRITTVTVAGDGVKFPVGAQGANMIVTNASANAMNLWPGLGDSINALAANTALSIPAGKTATAFVATLAAPFVWHVVIGA